MPRFIQAIKSIATGRAHVKVMEEVPPSAYRRAVAFLLAAASSFQERIPDQVKAAISNFAGDKSKSEVIFLASILLTVLLFVVVLPAYETLFGEGNDNDTEVKEEEEEVAMSPSRMRMYKPGVGVVEIDTSEIVETTSLSRVSSGASSSSSRSVTSHGSGSMETIEESEEEYLNEEEDEVQDNDQSGDDQDKVRVETTPEELNEEIEVTREVEDEEVHPNEESKEIATPSSPVADTKENTSLLSPIAEAKEIATPTPIEKPEGVVFDDGESTPDKVKYYEFLQFINSDNNSPLKSSGARTALREEGNDGSQEVVDEKRSDNDAPRQVSADDRIPEGRSLEGPTSVPAPQAPAPSKSSSPSRPSVVPVKADESLGLIRSPSAGSVSSLGLGSVTSISSFKSTRSTSSRKLRRKIKGSFKKLSSSRW
eukprot:CAMPEP_0183718030 /NCGR_PEP_ID=MMETSP0737-20130205/11400_1 /TAXON_ID=385413 /ORGANISM="Thalassiosira miniscula, Strain CCMP1093" /LENGTH=424 /DNA_ID=CAMNT_0025947511 /DNA_START=44 /DNA_END=1318 /DNA_ORIENTATION=+